MIFSVTTGFQRFVFGLGPSTWPVAESLPGEGVTWQLQFEGRWSLGLVLLVLLILQAVTISLYLREWSHRSALFRILLAQLRVLTFVVLILMLSQASLAFFRVGLPYLPILVDDSASMATVDKYSRTEAAELEGRLALSGDGPWSRWQIVERIFTARPGSFLGRLQGAYRLRWHFLGSPAEAVPIPAQDGEWPKDRRPTTPKSELGTAVRTVLDLYVGTPPAALVMITDGVNTDGPGLVEAARWARSRNVPLFFVAVGKDVDTPDVELRDLTAEDPIFAGDLAVFSCTVHATRMAGQKITLTLKEASNAPPLQRVEVVPTQDTFQEVVTLSHRVSRVGLHRFVVEATSAVDENNLDNNRLERSVTVTDEKIRVLLAAGGPSYEFRYLKNLLMRERTIELRTFLQDADPGHSQQDASALSAFPIRPADLAYFDVIVLMDVNLPLLGKVAIDNLLTFVDPPESTGEAKAGSLVVVVGPRFSLAGAARTPFEKLLPVEIVPGGTGELAGQGVQPYRPKPSAFGLGFPGLQLADSSTENQAIWERLPVLYWHALLGTAKAGTRVLLEHPSLLGSDSRPMPLVAFHYVGKGAVFIQGFDETWRWRWRVGDLFFGRYWLQTIRFLARGRLSGRQRHPVLTTDRREYRFGEPVTIRLQFPEGISAPSSEAVTVLMRAGDTKPQPFSLVRRPESFATFEGTLTQPIVGWYRVWYSDPKGGGEEVSAEFRVLPPVGELSRLEADRQAMMQAAELTGGVVLSPWEVDRLPDFLPRGQTLPLEALPPRPIWNSWPVLLAFVLLLTVEWILRKLGGMA